VADEEHDALSEAADDASKELHELLSENKGLVRLLARQAVRPKVLKSNSKFPDRMPDYILSIRGMVPYPTDDGYDPTALDEVETEFLELLTPSGGDGILLVKPPIVELMESVATGAEDALIYQRSSTVQFCMRCHRFVLLGVFFCYMIM
jgi:hypothetical protein